MKIKVLCFGLGIALLMFMAAWTESTILLTICVTFFIIGKIGLPILFMVYLIQLLARLLRPLVRRYIPARGKSPLP